MGNKRSGRRSIVAPPLSRAKSIPTRWLSCPEFGQPITIPQNTNLIFIPMKTPLPESYSEALGPRYEWTVPKAIEKVQSLVSPPNPHFHAINVSHKNEIITEDDWSAHNITYSRVSISKEYKPESIDVFCQIIGDKLNETTDGTLLCLLYCGSGLNRIGFCLSAILTKEYGFSLKDSLQICDESSPRLIYKQRPLDVLCEYFREGIISHGPAPEWVKTDTRPGPIGDIPLPLEKFNTLSKISKKNFTLDEKYEVLKILASATTVNWLKTSESFPVMNTTVWNPQSLIEIQTNVHLCTFEPRGERLFLIVTGDSNVYVVEPSMIVTPIRVRSKCEVPAVVSCVLIEEKKSRPVFLLTDILLYGSLQTYKLPLKDRLSYLANEFALDTSDIKDSGVQFIFRPMAEVSNASKLRRDLNSLFVKSDGISFFNCHEEAGKSLFLPIKPSFVFQFVYNGNDRAVLYARNNIPIGIYKAPNSKYNGMDDRTNRFIFDIDKNEWLPITVGNNNLPSTIEEVRAVLTFQQNNNSAMIDKIFSQLDKISYE
ncbi:mRNA-capping enzyme-like isoform X2 [Histomonas meleagridis]|uniref:mRNA-capping enzyme-like isoform X2 n=1 Tax=Histomonas meleagridis TaxID=135588 RepID=UPI00355965A5|nr:mRNA-capping enzyme-like isoform X2 [Histomonas meleagridis]KAH0800235.1 mRNA-capping enzyme-like isoform X2 [Histomonas meleagridis]